MIEIRKSPTADTRTCDVSKVTKETLIESSRQHIMDVSRALAFFSSKLMEEAACHDFDKLTEIDQFYSDFKSGFSQPWRDNTSWWDNHRKVNRHHLGHSDGVPSDVNLIDVIAYISDCVMAGMARSGNVYALEMREDLLMEAFLNTIDLLKKQVKVIE